MVLQKVSFKGLSWVDVENPTVDDVQVLGREYPFHHLNLDDCLSVRQLPKLEEHDSHIFLLFHIPEYPKDEPSIRKSQVSIFMGKTYLVTLHEKAVTRLGALFRSCTDDENTKSSMMRSPGHLLHSVLDVLVDGMYPALDHIEDDLEKIEDRVFDQKVSVAVELSRLRRVIADGRRIVSPLRRLLPDLSAKVGDYTSENLLKYYRDVHDHVEKAWEVLEQDKETIEIFKDTDFILSTELTNRVLAVLTVVFTLTIPPTVVGAIYGMNIPLPGGLATGPYTFLGTFTTFALLMGLSVAAAVGMGLWFRREGWL